MSKFAAKLLPLVVLSALASGCGAQPADETASETTSETTDTSAGETADESAEVCTDWPIGDPLEAATPYTITFVNSGDTPRFIVPPACIPGLLSFSRLDADVQLRDDTETSCELLQDDPNNIWCGDPCDGWVVTAPIRVEPGGSWVYEWDGHAWEYSLVDEVCLAEIDACFNACHAGVALPDGTALRLRLRSEGCNLDPQANPAACECTPVDGSCALPTELDSSTFDGGVAVELEFIKGEGELVVELALP